MEHQHLQCEWQTAAKNCGQTFCSTVIMAGLWPVTVVAGLVSSEWLFVSLWVALCSSDSVMDFYRLVQCTTLVETVSRMRWIRTRAVTYHWRVLPQIVATKVSFRQAYFCRDKRRVLSRQIRVVVFLRQNCFCRDKNDTRDSSRQLTVAKLRCCNTASTRPVSVCSECCQYWPLKQATPLLSLQVFL